MSCPDCFKGTAHEHGKAVGRMEKLHGYDTYVSAPPSSSSSKSQIFFITDAFGLKLINNKLLADKYAEKTGHKVLMPDIIPGGPCDISAMNYMHTLTEPVGWTDIWGQIGRIIALFKTLAIMAPFLYRASPGSAVPRVLEYARAMKKDIGPGGKLGVAGFCWGGFGSTALCVKTAVEDGSERLIDAQFCAHPSGLKAPDMVVDAVKTFKAPYSMAIGDKDIQQSEKITLATEAKLREVVGEPESNNYEIKIYKGCKHGFAVRADPNNATEMQGMESAQKQAVDWFKKWL